MGGMCTYHCDLNVYVMCFMDKLLQQDPEIGQQAGLASMETLDDSMGEKAEKLTNGDDGMESVKLDTEVRNVLLFHSQVRKIRHS